MNARTITLAELRAMPVPFTISAGLQFEEYLPASYAGGTMQRASASLGFADIYRLCKLEGLDIEKTINAREKNGHAKGYCYRIEPSSVVAYHRAAMNAERLGILGFQRYRLGKDQYGDPTYTERFQRLIDNGGDSAFVAKAQRMRKLAMRIASAYLHETPRPSYAVAGGAPNVARTLVGNPLCMRKRKPMHMPAPLRVYVDVSANVGNRKYLQTRLSVILATLELVASQQPVELYGTKTSYTMASDESAIVWSMGTTPHDAARVGMLISEASYVASCLGLLRILRWGRENISTAASTNTRTAVNARELDIVFGGVSNVDVDMSSDERAIESFTRAVFERAAILRSLA